MGPDIRLLRVQRPDLEDELSRQEADNRTWIARYGDPSTTCYGVMIPHEGRWALARTLAGSTITQCSRGKDCLGHDLMHGSGNPSCRMVMSPCPACELNRSDVGHSKIGLQPFLGPPCDRTRRGSETSRPRGRARPGFQWMSRDGEPRPSPPQSGEPVGGWRLDRLRLSCSELVT
jgi:hypothetical protein